MAQAWTMILASVVGLGLSKIALGEDPNLSSGEALRVAAGQQVTRRELTSPKGTFRVRYEKPPKVGTDEERIVLVTKEGSYPLPPQEVWVDFPSPDRKDAHQGKSDRQPNGGECYFSPDEKWLYVDQKLYTGCAVGYLYKRESGLRFRPVSPLQFDLMAWRYYARRKGLSTAHVPTKDRNIHLIDFIQWSPDSRHLVFRLRPLPGYTEKQGWGWTGYFDTRTQRFGSGNPVKARKRA
jgi:hypothetical protein